MRRFYGIADLRAVMMIGYRALFGVYISGLPEDSAFIRKLRQPHEQRQQAKDDLTSRFKEIHG